MTTIELNEADLAQSSRAGQGWLTRLLAAWKLHRETRQALMTLSSMDARLLRDMGIEPSDVLAALDTHRRSLRRRRD